MAKYSEAQLKEIFYSAVSTLENAGFTIKDIFFDDFESAVRERDQCVKEQKDFLCSDKFKNSEPAALLAKLDNILGENGRSDKFLKDLDHMPYPFETPYVEFYYPEEGILIPILANNLPVMMELEFIRFNDDKDFDNNSVNSRYHYCNYNKFKSNHKSEKPIVALSLLAHLVDISNAENYRKAREDFFISLLDLSKLVLQSSSQWKATMEMLEIADSKKSIKRKRPKKNGN